MARIYFNDIESALFNIAYKELVMCLELCDCAMYDWDEYEEECPTILKDDGDFSYYLYIHKMELIDGRIKIYSEGSETHTKYETWLDEETHSLKEIYDITMFFWINDGCSDDPAIKEAQQVINECTNKLKELL